MTSHVDPRLVGTARPAFMQLRAAAAFVGLSPATLRRAVREGALPARLATLRHGSRTRRLLFRPEDLVAWVEAAFAPVESVKARADALLAEVRSARPRTARR